MFCYKCGKQIAEDAEFCHMCGTKAVLDDTVEQPLYESAQTEVAKPISQQSSQAPDIPVSTVTSDNFHVNENTVDTLPHKNKSWLFVLIAAVAVIIVVIFSIWNNSNNGKSDSNSSLSSVNLSQTYTNDAEGISFNYPSDWTFIDNSESNNNTLMWLTNEGTYIAISKSDGTYDLSTFTLDYFEERYSLNNDELVIIDLLSVDLDGIVAKKIVYSGVNKSKEQFIIDSQYFYNANEHGYTVGFVTFDQFNFDKYNPVFDEIMDSYKITGKSNSGADAKSSFLTETEARKIADEWLINHPKCFFQKYYGVKEFDNYYGFNYDSRGCWAAYVIVDKKTSELSRLEVYYAEDYNEDSEITEYYIDSLDDWYTQWYEDIDGPNSGYNYANDPYYDDDPNNEKWQALKNKTLTFGSTFEYKEMEYTIGNNWGIIPEDFFGVRGDDYIQLPIRVRNNSNDTKSISLIATAFGPNGTEVLINALATFPENYKQMGQMRAGTSQDLYMYIKYEGDGVYWIEIGNNADIEIELSVRRY